MKSRKNKPEPDEDRGRRDEKPEIRKDLQDGSKGKDLSYLNEMPQMGGYEGVKAGAPPPRKGKRDKKNMADES